MSIALLPFSTGRNVRCLIQPLTKSLTDFSIVAAGVGPFSLQGRLKTNADDFQYHDADLTPMDGFLDNPVTHGATGSYTFTEMEGYTATFAGVSMNILKGCSVTSLYAALAIQKGYVNASNVFVPTSMDCAIVKFTTNGRSADKESEMRTASFVLVPYVDASTGGYRANPILSVTTGLDTPFGFLTA